MPRHPAMTLSLAMFFLVRASGDAHGQGAPAARFPEHPDVGRAQQLRDTEARTGPRWTLAAPAEFLTQAARSDGPRSAGRVAVGGLLGGGAAAGALAMAGALATLSLGGCSEDCGLGGMVVGALVGEMVGLPLGAHLANGRRGSLALDLLESVALGGGAVVAGAAGGERSLQVLASAAPVLQLAGIAATERRSLRGLTVGAKSGWVGARMAGARGTRGRSGAGVGGVVAFQFTEDVALQSELLYVRKGMSTTDATQRRLSAAYFEVPLLLAVTLAPRQAPVHPFLLAGGAAAVNLRCAAEPPSPEGYGCPYYFGLAEHDYSLVGGAGVRVPLDGLDGTLEVRYDHGLTRNRVGEPTLPQLLVARNRAVMVLAGMAVRLGRERGVSRVP